MEIDVITNLIEKFAFPVAIAILLLFGLFKIISSYKATMDKQLDEYKSRIDKQTDDVEKIVDKYHEDYMKVTDALNNNTNALNMLSKLVETFIHKKEDD